MAKAKLTKSSLPKGYREISATAESHDWDADPILEGIVKRIDTVTIENKPRKVMHIEKADGGREAVWESAGLVALFECSIGAAVYIHFVGFGEAKKKGHNPPRLFEIGVKEANPM